MTFYRLRRMNSIDATDSYACLQFSCRFTLSLRLSVLVTTVSPAEKDEPIKTTFAEGRLAWAQPKEPRIGVGAHWRQL